MLLTFFAISTGFALVISRPILDKVVIVLSALPIAIIANVIRIVVTAIVAETVGGHAANLVFHDLAGWLMMPLALGFLAVELLIIDKLFIHRPEGDQASQELEGFVVPSVPAPVASI